jgi:hypothetical protein
MTNLRAWVMLWQTTSVAGAPMGTALNTADPTLWPRWLMMFGLALTTTAAYIVVDTTFFVGKGSPQGIQRKVTIHRRDQWRGSVQWTDGGEVERREKKIGRENLGRVQRMLSPQRPLKDLPEQLQREKEMDGAAPVTDEEHEAYTRWATGFALKLYTVGLVWFAVTGAWYVFGTWPVEQRQMMLSGGRLLLTGLTAVGPGLPWILIFVSWRRGVTHSLALGTGLAQFGVVALNAVSRQVVQNAELKEFFDVTAEQVNVQWSPMILFLMFFVAGIGVMVWMISRLSIAARQSG